MFSLPKIQLPINKIGKYQMDLLDMMMQLYNILFEKLYILQKKNKI